MNYSKNVTVDENGLGSGGDLSPVLEFDAKEIDSASIYTDSAIYIGFTEISQAVRPLAANSSFNISHLDFRPKNQSIQNIIRIYAKKQIAGTATLSISFLGGNR